MREVGLGFTRIRNSQYLAPEQIFCCECQKLKDFLLIGTLEIMRQVDRDGLGAIFDGSVYA